MIDLKEVLYKTKFYIADKELNLKITNSGKSVIFNNAETDPNELIKFGITTYPTEPLLQFKGETLTLYDPIQNLYFDGRQNLNQWMPENPTPFYNEIQLPDGIHDIHPNDIMDLSLTTILINHTSYRNPEQEIAKALYYDGKQVEDTRNLINNNYLQQLIINKQPDYEKIIYVFIQLENGQTINGIAYNYGDAIPVTMKRRGINGTERFFYSSIPLFNDNNEYTEQQFDETLFEYRLTTTDPTPLIIGVTTELPQRYNDIPQTHWWWSGGFNNGTSIERWYQSNTGATASPPYIDNYIVPVNEGQKYTDAIISNGTTTTRAIALKLIKYASSSSTEFSAQGTSISRSSTRANNVIVVYHNPILIPDTWPLPTGLYTLSGRTITWDTTNNFYLALYGIQII